MAKPKGRILLVGGAEDKGSEEESVESFRKHFKHLEILEALVPHKRHGRIEIITTASIEPADSQKRYTEAFHKVGAKNIGFIDIKSKEEAREDEFIERINKAQVVFFTGGDQFRVSTILGGTAVQEALQEKYLHDANFIVGGTSAGAMALPTIILTETTSREALHAGHVHTTAGLGLLERCIVDTHFIQRGRFGRLAHAVIVNPSLLGVGLGEDTAMLIKNGCDAECFGSGMVVIIDAMGIDQTNITEQKEGLPVFVENLRVDLLIRGCRYSLSKRRLHRPAIARNYKPNGY